MKLHPYKIPIKEMVERYQRLYTAAIIDIFQERNMHHQWLGPDIKCRTKELGGDVVAGFAFTVQWIFDPRPDERDRPAAKMVESYPEDSIIVVDAGADQVSGFWGELATNVCIRNGVKGAVINGGAKDTGFVKMMGFPIFCRFTTPVDGFYRSRLRGWQIPIWFNDILIHPGDFIVGGINFGCGSSRALAGLLKDGRRPLPRPLGEGWGEGQRLPPEFPSPTACRHADGQNGPRASPGCRRTRLAPIRDRPGGDNSRTR